MTGNLTQKIAEYADKIQLAADHIRSLKNTIADYEERMRASASADSLRGQLQTKWDQLALEQETLSRFDKLKAAYEQERSLEP